MKTNILVVILLLCSLLLSSCMHNESKVLKAYNQLLEDRGKNWEAVKAENLRVGKNDKGIYQARFKVTLEAAKDISVKYTPYGLDNSYNQKSNIEEKLPEDALNGYITENGSLVFKNSGGFIQNTGSLLPLDQEEKGSRYLGK